MKREPAREYISSPDIRKPRQKVGRFVDNFAHGTGLVVHAFHETLSLNVDVKMIDMSADVIVRTPAEMALELAKLIPFRYLDARIDVRNSRGVQASICQHEELEACDAKK